MASINEILGKNIDSIKALKAEIRSLQDSLVGLDAESQEYKDTSLKLVAAQEELTKVTRAGKEENVAATDSIRGMEKEYKSLYDTYKMLSEEQRNSSFGKEMASQLETLSTKINETKQGVGNFKDNIGRYASSVTEAFSKMGMSAGALQGPLKAATTGTNGFGASLKALAANPIVLVITALVAILVKAAEAIKNNEELTNRLKEAMSVFKPVLDGISNAFNFLAGILVKTIEGLSKVGEKILSIIPGYKEAAKSHKELAKATNELTKAQREANVENSKKEAEIERLREEASATDDVVEKKKLLEEAKAMQAEIDQKNIELAQEELRIQEEYAAKTANSAEDNEKLAAAQAKVNDAIAQGERNMRQYNKQLDQVDNKTKSATSSGKNWREEAKKVYEETLEYNKTEIQKITEKYEKEKKLLEKYHYDTKLLTKKYNKEINSLIVERESKRLKESEESYRQAKESLELNSKMWTEEERLVDRIKSIENLEPNNTIFDLEFNKKYGKLLEQNTYLADALYLAVEKDLTQITDYNRVLGQINYNIDLYKEKQPWESKKWEEVKEVVEKFGEVNWFNLTKSLQQAATKLKTDFPELDLGSSLKLGLSAEDIKKNVLPGLYDALADIHIGKKVGEEYRKELEEELNLLRGGFDEYDFNELASMNTYSYLEAQRNALQEELTDFQGTKEKKLELMQQYYEVLHEMRENDWADEKLNAERNASIWEASFDRFNAVAAAYDSIIDTIKSYMQAEVDSGKLTKKEADRKKKTLENLEKVQVAVAVANIAANTAAGVMDVWRGYASELPVNAQTAAASGPAAAATKAALDAKSLAAAIIRTSTLAVQGTSQIAAAIGGYVVKSNASAAESAGGGSTGVGVTPAVIDSTPYSYTRTVQTEEDVDMINQRPIWVSVTDIESGLGQRAQVVGESSF